MVLKIYKQSFLVKITLVILFFFIFIFLFSFQKGSKAFTELGPVNNDNEKSLQTLLASSDLNKENSSALELAADDLSEFDLLNVKLENNTLYEKLKIFGISSKEIMKLSVSFKDSFDFRYSLPVHKFSAKTNNEGLIEKFVYKTDPENQFVAVRNESDFFDVSKKEIVPDITVETSEFEINSSFYEAVVKSGESPALAAQFAEIFSWDIDFYLYPRKNDKIQILYEKKFINQSFCGYGKILAARYIGSKDSFSAFYFDDGKTKGYYDESGSPLRKMFLRVPVKFGVLTSSFSIRRFHPVLGKYKPHTGIDYGAPKGTPIFATANGVVIFSGWQNGYGNLVILKHPNGYKTYYGHCDSLIAKKGEKINQGQILAKVGETGIATGPHVHYEVRINNKPVDPNTLKSERGRPIVGGKLETFKTLVQVRTDYMNNQLGESQEKLIASLVEK
ncbi:MAG: peptidoglycan DD-metalloendopeptidase family protein [Desulforegulaceae bacterium]|nr:peptidoglycan DD-metalloendopeptidase family protein [Desulforegulaceae bacterium]